MLKCDSHITLENRLNITRRRAWQSHSPGGCVPVLKQHYICSISMSQEYKSNALRNSFYDFLIIIRLSVCKRVWSPYFLSCAAQAWYPQL